MGGDNILGLESGVSGVPTQLAIHPRDHMGICREQIVRPPFANLGPEYSEAFGETGEVVIFGDPDNYFDRVLPCDELVVRLNDKIRGEQKCQR